MGLGFPWLHLWGEEKRGQQGKPPPPQAPADSHRLPGPDPRPRGPAGLTPFPRRRPTRHPAMWAPSDAGTEAESAGGPHLPPRRDSCRGTVGATCGTSSRLPPPPVSSFTAVLSFESFPQPPPPRPPGKSQRSPAGYIFLLICPPRAPTPTPPPPRGGSEPQSQDVVR